MNVKKKEAAVKRFASLHTNDNLPAEQMKIEIMADDKGYTAEEADEIIAAILAGETGGDSKESAPAKPEAKPEPETIQGYRYPEFDLWSVDAKSLGENRFEFTTIKALRKGVKLEQEAADSLNTQSHNSRRRYYPAGEVTNGHTEIATVI